MAKAVVVKGRDVVLARATGWTEGRIAGFVPLTIFYTDETGRLNKDKAVLFFDWGKPLEPDWAITWKELSEGVGRLLGTRKPLRRYVPLTFADEYDRQNRFGRWYNHEWHASGLCRQGADHACLAGNRVQANSRPMVTTSELAGRS